MTAGPTPRRYALLAVLALLACAGCGGACDFAVGVGSDATPGGAAPEAQKPAPALVPSTNDERPKIVALGDSLTAGNGLLETEAYPSLIQRMIDTAGYKYEVVNAGVSGDTSAGGLRRLEWIMKDDVHVLIVALGANDGLRGLSVAQMKENLSQIVQRAKQKDVAVILAGMEAPPNYGPEYATAYRQAFVDVAREHRVTFIPFLLSGVAGVASLNQADGIHPTAQGAAMMANTVWKALQPVLDLLASS